MSSENTKTKKLVTIVEENNKYHSIPSNRNDEDGFVISTFSKLVQASGSCDLSVMEGEIATTEAKIIKLEKEEPQLEQMISNRAKMIEEGDKACQHMCLVTDAVRKDVTKYRNFLESSTSANEASTNAKITCANYERKLNDMLARYTDLYNNRRLQMINNIDLANSRYVAKDGFIREQAPHTRDKIAQLRVQLADFEVNNVEIKAHIMKEQTLHTDLVNAMKQTENCVNSLKIMIEERKNDFDKVDANKIIEEEIFVKKMEDFERKSQEHTDKIREEETIIKALEIKLLDSKHFNDNLNESFSKLDKENKKLVQSLHEALRIHDNLINANSLKSRELANQIAIQLLHLKNIQKQLAEDNLIKEQIESEYSKQMEDLLNEKNTLINLENKNNALDKTNEKISKEIYAHNLEYIKVCNNEREYLTKHLDIENKLLILNQTAKENLKKFEFELITIQNASKLKTDEIVKEIDDKKQLIDLNKQKLIDEEIIEDKASANDIDVKNKCMAELKNEISELNQSFKGKEESVASITFERDVVARKVNEIKLVTDQQKIKIHSHMNRIKIPPPPLNLTKIPQIPFKKRQFDEESDSSLEGISVAEHLRILRDKKERKRAKAADKEARLRPNSLK